MKLIFGKTGVYCIPFQFRFVLYLDNFLLDVDFYRC